VTVICSDKTGTLTRNEMTVQQVFTAAHCYRVDGVGYAPEGQLHCDDGQLCDIAQSHDLLELARAGLLANNATLFSNNEGWGITGDPTEAALLTLAGKLGLQHGHEAQLLPQVDAIPFNSEQRCTASLHHDHAHHGLIYMIGAPERLLAVCNRQWRDGRPEALDIRHWHQALDSGASQGLRMLGLAMRPLAAPQHELSYEDLNGDYVLLGLVGMLDPPREEAIAAIAECHSAGIAVKMITGDHAGTASAIAARLGLSGGQPLTGTELDKLSDAELDRLLPHTCVFARTSPAHKLRLVQRLQASGARVAMTGDGVNDAPALKRADIGVAMGIKGTEAAKEAAQMVLADDNFATIAGAVREGRAIYDNLKKFILFALPTNGGQALIVIAAILFQLTLPLTPAQVLWINMVTSVTLGLALAFEPAESGLMDCPPRAPDEPLLSGFFVWRVLLVSLLMAGAGIGLFLWELQQGTGLDSARTMALNAVVMCEVFYLINSRRIFASVLSFKGLFGSRAVLLAIAACLLLQALYTYAPPMQRLFHSTALDTAQWARVVLAGLAVFVIAELEKWLIRRWHLQPSG